MKSTYIFWYRLKNGQEYLIAKVLCKKPNMTKAKKTCDKLISTDDDVDACGWAIDTDEYMAKFRLPHLLPHESRQK